MISTVNANIFLWSKYEDKAQYFNIIYNSQFNHACWHCTSYRFRSKLFLCQVILKDAHLKMSTNCPFLQQVIVSSCPCCLNFSSIKSSTSFLCFTLEFVFFMPACRHYSNWWILVSMSTVLSSPELNSFPLRGFYPLTLNDAFWRPWPYP